MEGSESHDFVPGVDSTTRYVPGKAVISQLRLPLLCSPSTLLPPLTKHVWTRAHNTTRVHATHGFLEAWVMVESSAPVLSVN
jgi:hypothetical protein